MKPGGAAAGPARLEGVYVMGYLLPPRYQLEANEERESYADRAAGVMRGLVYGPEAEDYVTQEEFVNNTPRMSKAERKVFSREAGKGFLFRHTLQEHDRFPRFRLEALGDYDWKPGHLIDFAGVRFRVTDNPMGCLLDVMPTKALTVADRISLRRFLLRKEREDRKNFHHAVERFTEALNAEGELEY